MACMVLWSVRARGHVQVLSAPKFSRIQSDSGRLRFKCGRLSPNVFPAPACEGRCRNSRSHRSTLVGSPLPRRQIRSRCHGHRWDQGKAERRDAQGDVVRSVDAQAICAFSLSLALTRLWTEAAAASCVDHRLGLPRPRREAWQIQESCKRSCPEHHCERPHSGDGGRGSPHLAPPPAPPLAGLKSLRRCCQRCS